MNNISFSKINLKNVLYFFIMLFLLIMLYLYRSMVVDIIKPFLIAAVISYLLNPIVEMFERRGLKRLLGVIIVYLSFIGIILFFGFFIVPKLIRDIGKLVETLPTYSKNIQNILDGFQDGYVYNNLPDSIKGIIDDNILALQSMILDVLQKATDSIVSMLSQLFDIILVPVIIFYMLKDTSYFKSQMMLVIPKSKRTRAILLFRDIDNVFGKFIRGQIIIAFFVGVMATVTLLIFGVKYAVVLGIFAGVSDIIPYFGPVLGIVPAALFAFFDEPAKALYVTGAFVAIQQIESGILSPKILGESVGIHPVYVILALLIGGNLFGLVGLIIAVPAVAALKLSFRHMLRK